MNVSVRAPVGVAQPGPLLACECQLLRERVFADKPNSARVTASRRLAKVNVHAALEVGFAARQQRTQTEADATVRELKRVAYSDIGAYFDAQGNVKPLSELTADQCAAIASIRVVKKNPFAGAVEYVHEIKLWNKPRALEVLGKHEGLFHEAPPDDATHWPAFVLPSDCPGVKVH